jgi:hypothetical protein
MSTKESTDSKERHANLTGWRFMSKYLTRRKQHIRDAPAKNPYPILPKPNAPSIEPCNSASNSESTNILPTNAGYWEWPNQPGSHTLWTFPCWQHHYHPVQPTTYSHRSQPAKKPRLADKPTTARTNRFSYTSGHHYHDQPAYTSRRNGNGRSYPIHNPQPGARRPPEQPRSEPTARNNGGGSNIPHLQQATSTTKIN